MKFYLLSFCLVLCVACTLTAPAVQAGPLTFTAVPITSATSLPGTAYIPATFNSTPISAGDTIWFSATVRVSGGSPTRFDVIRFTRQRIALIGRAMSATVDIPDGILYLDPSAMTCTTTYVKSLNLWMTRVPAGETQDIFISGAALPVRTSLPGNIPAFWAGLFTQVPGPVATDPYEKNLTLEWQWAAAVYTKFPLPGSYNLLQVKACQDNGMLMNPVNPDPAGTPEALKAFVTAGALGYGGTNYTGTPTSPQTIILNPIEVSPAD